MLNTRLANLPNSPFERLGSLLTGVAPPLEPLDLTIGEPQHPYPDWIARDIQDARHLWGKYAPRRGTLPLLQSIAGYLTRRYHLPQGMIEPARHIVPLTGTREGLFLVVNLVTPPVKAGKQPAVLIPNPFYHAYAGAALAAGAEPVFVSARADTGFLPDPALLDDDLLARTSAFFLCSPANPQGVFASKELLWRMIELARLHDFVLLLDECYAEIYNDLPPTGGLEVCAATGGDMRNVLVFHSLSKRSSAPGLRSGFVAGDPDILAKFGALRDYASAIQPLPVQHASATLWNDDAHVEANRNLYRQKFAAADRILGQKPGYDTPPGGFFLWLNVGDGVAAARRLWAGQGVKVVPGSYLSRDDALGNPGAEYIRVALVQDLAKTESALHRIAGAV
ncbi:MAG: aminotransferase class I/II-fold pyridoxal phosphate-dependent enzyme [Rhodospirillales bacterium]